MKRNLNETKSDEIKSDRVLTPQTLDDYSNSRVISEGTNRREFCLWNVIGLTLSKSLRDHRGEFLQGNYLLIISQMLISAMCYTFDRKEEKNRSMG